MVGPSGSSPVAAAASRGRCSSRVPPRDMSEGGQVEAGLREEDVESFSDDQSQRE